MKKVLVTIGAAGLLITGGLLLAQSKPKTAVDGVYTADQAKRGNDAWTAKCAECHGGEMQGGPEAPAMFGEQFYFSYGGKPVSTLYDYMHMNMPPGEPGSLSDQRYADIIAAIFAKNGYPAGQAELPGDPKALANITIPKDAPAK